MGDRTNTIFGWILFAGVIGLGLSIISGKIFHADSPERPETLGFVVEGVVEDGDGTGGPSLAMLLASGDAAAGAKAAAGRCGTCHSFEQGGPSGTGPNLYGIYGSPVGGHSGSFAYSSALKDVGGSWGYENMDEWLKSPRGFAPGTKMSFAGLGNAEDRADLLLYLRELGGGPALPEVEEAAPAEGEGEPEVISDEDGLAEPAKLEAEAMANQPADPS